MSYDERLEEIREAVRLEMAPLYTMCETVLHNCPDCFAYDDATFVVGCKKHNYPVPIKECIKCYRGEKVKCR